MKKRPKTQAIGWPLLDDFAIWKIRSDAQRWTAMLILADAIEEHEPDEIALASGWRWLAINRFRPLYDGQNRIWVIRPPSYENLDGTPSDGTVPSRAFHWINEIGDPAGKDPYGERMRYASRYDAEMELAEAIAMAKIKPKKWKCPRRYTTCEELKYDLY